MSIVVLLLAACGDTSSVGVFATCELRVDLADEAVVPNDAVTVVGGPFLDERSVVGRPEREVHASVGGVDAEVVEVTSGDAETAAACAECQLCRAEASCAQCGTCDGFRLEFDRRQACFGDPRTEEDGFCGACTQQLTFVVPALDEGDYPLTILSPFGASPPVTLSVD